MDRFHEYLYGGKFDVYTDNNPLTYILSSAKLDACGQRWEASLINYDFQLFYKTGRTNVDADALSRIPRNGYYELESPVIKALLKSSQEVDWTDFNGNPSDSQEVDWTDFNGNPSDIVCISSQIITEKMATEQWKMEQANDETTSQVIEAMKAGSGECTFSSELAKTDVQVKK